MHLRRLLIIVTSFAIAMGFLESAVVVYLREILYPEGFDFPLTTMPVRLAVTELLREAATLGMLVTLGMLAGRRFSTGWPGPMDTSATTRPRDPLSRRGDYCRYWV